MGAMVSLCRKLGVLFSMFSYEMSIVLDKICLSHVTEQPTCNGTGSTVLSARNELPSS